jgi:hypothetical protein
MTALAGWPPAVPCLHTPEYPVPSYAQFLEQRQPEAVFTWQ